MVKKWPRLFSFAMVLVLAVSILPAPASAVNAQSPSALFISEYIEGSSYNKAIEIYNNTTAAIDLAAEGYNLQMYFNGSTSAALTINLTGVVAPGDVYVVAHSSAVAGILAQADQTNGAGWFNGDDAVVLRRGTTFIDVIGQVGFDPGSEWGTDLVSTADNTLRRMGAMCEADPIGSDVFVPSLQWDGFATNEIANLGVHSAACGADPAPEITSVSPAHGATGVPVSADLVITFSEPVNLTGSWFTISCPLSGTRNAGNSAVSGGPTAFTINPDTDFDSNEVCTLEVSAMAVSDQDLIDPLDTMQEDFSSLFSLMDYMPAYAIQGSGPDAALTGTVVTRGVVVGDYEGASPTLRGFYLQDPLGDGDASTSDAVFVYNGSRNQVNLGDIVRVTGTVSEYQGQTQLSAASSTAVVIIGAGTVTPVEVTLPVLSADFLERYEGMLVRLPQELTVTEHYQLGRFGQVVLSSGGRLAQPTNIVDPGPDALALQAANNLNRIILDDPTNTQNPDPILFGRGGNPLSAANTLRGGDTVTGVVGVMTYTWGGNSVSPNAYRVRPVNALGGGVPDFTPVNPRPDSAPDVGGTLRVAGMNLLNYYNTFTGCTMGVGGAATDCRGAYDQDEFDRQWPKTVAAILGTQAGVVGLVELENDGYGPESAVQDLVDRLNNAAGPGTYAFIDVDAGTGQVNALGLDAIKVGMIYKTAEVVPVGTTAALNSAEFVNAGDSDIRNRPALAQAFEQLSTGARFVVSVNHLKSKGSACDAPDTGDGQGECSIVRTNAAGLLAAWLASDPTGTGDPDAIILGDLNSYAMEDPVKALESAGFTNLIRAFEGDGAYSYVFDGQWGYLDHALASASLASQVSGAADWHINSDEPSVLDYNMEYKTPGQLNSLFSPDQFRISDHDPVLVGLTLNAPPTVDAGGPYPVNEGGSVVVTAAGSDPNGDPLAYEWDLDNDGTFETPGQSVAFSAANLDGPASYTIQVKVTDPLGLSAVDEARIDVLNVTPTAEFIFPAAVYEGGVFDLWLENAFDPSLADTAAGFAYAFDCADGAGLLPAGANSAGCSAPYGFEGEITVSASITDKDGGVTAYSGVVAIMSSRQAKQDARAALAALLPTGDANNDLRIGKAVSSIDQSLDTGLWLSGSRLSPQGVQVFEQEKQAVSELSKIENPSPEVTRAVSMLVEVDRVLAQTAVNDALAASGSQDFIRKAQGSMDEGLAALGAGDFETAVGFFAKTWQFAVQAVK